MEIRVVENVTKANDEVAALNRQLLRRAGVFTVDLMGAPGAGKTALIEATLPRLTALKCAVINGDLATSRDAQRVAKHAHRVVQINTGKTCHLEAHHVRNALEGLDLTGCQLLFIENVGNLICPVGFDLGQNVKVGLFNATGGDDKAAKHPSIVTEADVLILAGIDLLPYLSFDLDLFRSDVKRLNPKVELIELSSKTGHGMDRWLAWLRSRMQA
jgi:hydrogenase nickel incorporation protein HypB